MLFPSRIQWGPAPKNPSDRKYKTRLLTAVWLRLDLYLMEENLNESQLYRFFVILFCCLLLDVDTMWPWTLDLSSTLLLTSTAGTSGVKWCREEERALRAQGRSGRTFFTLRWGDNRKWWERLWRTNEAQLLNTRHERKLFHLFSLLRKTHVSGAWTFGELSRQSIKVVIIEVHLQLRLSDNRRVIIQR